MRRILQPLLCSTALALSDDAWTQTDDAEPASDIDWRVSQRNAAGAPRWQWPQAGVANSTLVATVDTANASPPAGEAEPSEPEGVSFGVYGELKSNSQANVPDQTRQWAHTVWTLRYPLDDHNALNAEWEWQGGHDHEGTLQAERDYQLFLEHRLHPDWTVAVGTMVIPSGRLARDDRSTSFYGVEPNPSEIAALHNGWHETGVLMSGQLSDALRASAGWFGSHHLRGWRWSEPADAAWPSVGNAGGWGGNSGQLFALDWQATSVWNLGSSVYTARSSDGSRSARDTVWHNYAYGLWHWGAWKWSAMVTASTLRDSASGSTRFGSAVVQAAYPLWKHGEHSVSAYAKLAGFSSAQASATGVARSAVHHAWTVGTQWNAGKHWVLKTDLHHRTGAPGGPGLQLGLAFFY